MRLEYGKELKLTFLFSATFLMKRRIAQYSFKRFCSLIYFEEEKSWGSTEKANICLIYCGRLPKRDVQKSIVIDVVFSCQTFPPTTQNKLPALIKSKPKIIFSLNSDSEQM
jgi:hypothetical protein